jgi:hypothetical protein
MVSVVEPVRPVKICVVASQKAPPRAPQMAAVGMPIRVQTTPDWGAKWIREGTKVVGVDALLGVPAAVRVDHIAGTDGVSGAGASAGARVRGMNQPARPGTPRASAPPTATTSGDAVENAQRFAERTTVSPVPTATGATSPNAAFLEAAAS